MNRNRKSVYSQCVGKVAQELAESDADDLSHLEEVAAFLGNFSTERLVPTKCYIRTFGCQKRTLPKEYRRDSILIQIFLSHLY